MRINNQRPVNSTDSTTPSTTRSDNAPPSSATPGTPSSSPAVSAQDYGLVPSFELQTLTALLAEVPPVRQDVLAETIRRLTSGQLQTPSALEETARALLGG